jgi:ABC-type nitrate/sulfonate/bicarbonate transport system ATPase subunit
VLPPPERNGDHSDRRSAVLALTDVVKEYPGSPPVRAIDGISLCVRESDFARHRRTDGSGKSTLLNLIGAPTFDLRQRAHRRS